MEFKDKVAIVTGASSGVGYAIADTFAKNGYNMVLAARRIEILKELAGKLNQQYGVQTLPVKTDLTILDDIKNLFKETREKFGKLNVLVNVAGEFPAMSFVDSDPEEFITRHEKGCKFNVECCCLCKQIGVGYAYGKQWRNY